MAYVIQLGFQDATSPIVEQLLHFHDRTLIIIFLISSLVLYIISLILTTKLAGVQSRWIQGNLKGEQCRQGKLIYLIRNIKRDQEEIVW